MAMIFCYECGTKYSDAGEKCPKCAAPNRLKHITDRHWIVAFLLASFFGMFGAHRFYLRQNNSAVIMLILTLTFYGMAITCVWAFVDWIILLCHAGNDKYINDIANTAK